MIELALPVVYITALALFVAEKLYPAHRNKSNVSWYVRAVIINAVNLLVFIGFSTFVDVVQLEPVFELKNQVSPLAGASIAYFIFTFVVYWWHRLRHSSDFLWRTFHQLHHSPKRIETLTAYYIHPLDMVANLMISNTIVFYLLGLGLEAAAWYTVITGIAGFIIHANLRLPRQIGYVFQTPEMHRLHHASNHHSNNYSDIVFWDMLFGTYKNPHDEIEQCGFTEQDERRVMAMLLAEDVYGSSK